MPDVVLNGRFEHLNSHVGRGGCCRHLVERTTTSRSRGDGGAGAILNGLFLFYVQTRFAYVVYAL